MSTTAEAEVTHAKPHMRPQALLSVNDLVVEYRGKDGTTVKAVSGVSIDLLAGETLGLVGESGCGKSSTARAILQLPRPNEGSVRIGDVELVTLKGQRLREQRPRIQAIFQDPTSSLNPRRSVGALVAEPARVWSDATRSEINKQVDEALLAVGLDPQSVRGRRATQLSGGQCQRISIARALMLKPQIIVCDEPVSALDVSVQAQILNLLTDLISAGSLSLLFISHDLAVVRNICDRVGVMYLGKLCEVGANESLFAAPAHPYTRALMAAAPHVEDVNGTASERERLVGEIPSPMNPPSGCRFRTRCPLARARCAEEEPAMRPVGDDHFVACHFPLVPVNEAPLDP